jgi:CRP-like cAMP-binding protein
MTSAPRFAATVNPIVARSAVVDNGPDAALERISVILPIKRGRTLVSQGDAAQYVYCVVRGALRAVKLLSDGRRHVADFLLPGDFIGLTDIGTHGHSIEAVEDTVLKRYPRRGFETVLQADPRVGRHFLSFVCNELSAAQERLLLLGRKSAMERLTAFLINMAEQTPMTAGGKDGCTLSMTRVDIADYLGLTVETVSRLLSQLRSRGLIDLPRPQDVVFLNRAAIEGLSQGLGAELD